MTASPPPCSLLMSPFVCCCCVCQVRCFDLIIPGVGELIGGSEREERLEQLRSVRHGLRTDTVEAEQTDRAGFAVAHWIVVGARVFVFSFVQRQHARAQVGPCAVLVVLGSACLRNRAACVSTHAESASAGQDKAGAMHCAAGSSRVWFLRVLCVQWLWSWL